MLNKINTEKLIIISLTTIADLTLILMTVCIIFQRITGLESIALFISVVSGVVGALGGVYVNKKTDSAKTLTNNVETDISPDKI